MKNILAFCFVLLGSTNLYAQAQSSANDTDKIFLIVQQKPQFQGDIHKWLSENINYPKQARDSNIQGTVYVSFVIEKDGSISNVKLLKGVATVLDNEALRVIATMPQWTPGMKNGHVVRVQYIEPIHFILRDGRLPPTNNIDDAVYNTVEQQPKFQGDIQEWLDENVKFSERKAMDYSQQGVTDISFIIEKDGSVTNIRISRGVTGLLDTMIFQVFSHMPRWKPGIEKGVPVRTLYNFSINLIVLDNDSSKPHFPYGDVNNWIVEQINYPEEAAKRGIQGNVYVDYYIEKDGSISNIKIIDGIKTHALLNKEAVRIISAMPKWTPRFEDNRPKRTEMMAEIEFRVKDDSIFKAQNKYHIAETDSNHIYTLVVTKPQFPGNLTKWLQAHLMYPEQDRTSRIQGTVYVSFVVEKDGSITNTWLLKGVDRLLNDEAYTVVSEMPKWKPGTQNGKPVRVQYIQPISFTLY